MHIPLQDADETEVDQIAPCSLHPTPSKRKPTAAAISSPRVLAPSKLLAMSWPPNVDAIPVGVTL